LVDAQVALAGLPGLAECFGFDPVANENLTRTGFTLREKVDVFRDVASATSGWRGMAAAIGLGVHRAAFLGEARYTLHLAADGGDDAAARGTIEAARQTMINFPARELPDSIPRATRAKPFRPIKALLGPDGERWLPVHAVCPLSQARDALTTIQTVLAGRQADTAKHGIRISWLTSLVGNAFLIEPQFFWRDSLTPFHERHVTDEQRQRYKAQPADPEARAVVFAMRRELAEALDALGGAHFQIGRYYDYAGRLSPTARNAMQALKAAFDPHNLMNPGALGLTSSQRD
jgi:D-lactate dehydrogenase (cytochrome)